MTVSEALRAAVGQKKDGGNLLRNCTHDRNGLHLTGGDVELRAATQGTDQQLRLHAIGIGDENIDGTRGGG